MSDQPLDYTAMTGHPVGGGATDPDMGTEVMTRPFGEQEITDDLEALLVTLPPPLLAKLETADQRSNLVEVVMDLGRKPEARYHGAEVLLSDHEINHDDIRYVVER